LIWNRSTNAIDILWKIVRDLYKARVQEKTPLERNKKKVTEILGGLVGRTKAIDDIISHAYAIPAGISIPGITGPA